MMVHHITLKGMSKYWFQNSKCTAPHAILTAAVMWCCVLISEIRYKHFGELLLIKDMYADGFCLIISPLLI
jgi:hypothetical protein